MILISICLFRRFNPVNLEKISYTFENYLSWEEEQESDLQPLYRAEKK